MKRKQNNKLTELVDIIQLKTGKTQAEIAESVGKTAARLSIAMNGKSDITPWIVKLRAVYGDILPADNNKSGDDLIKENLAISKVLIGAVSEIIAVNQNLPISAVLAKFLLAIQREKESLG